MNSHAQLSYLQWGFAMGGSGNNPSYVNEIWSIYESSQGGLLVSGNVAGTIDLDPSPATVTAASGSPTRFASFVARYDSTRNHLGSFVLTASGDVLVRNVSTDASGDIYLAGEFTGSMDADPGSGTSTLNALQGGRDMFVAKYNSSGALVHAFSAGGNASMDQVYDMITDSAGNLYMTGVISDTVDFDPGPGVQQLNGTAGDDMFLASYSPSGQYRWAFMVSSSPMGQTGYSLDFDPQGNILVSLRFRGTVDVDPSPAQTLFAAIGANDLLLCRYTPQGALINAFQLGGPGGVSISESAIACDPAGNIFVAARFNGNLDVDPGPGTTILSSTGSSSVMVGRYTSAGLLSWAVLAGSNSISITSKSIAVDPAGSAYVTVPGTNGSVLTKFDAAGLPVYSKPMSASQNLYARSLHVRGVDAFTIGGGTYGTAIIDGSIIGGGNGYSPFLTRFGSCLVPEIINQPVSLTTCDSADVSFEISATGTGLAYQWYKDNVPLAGDTTSTLILDNTAAGNNGAYTCIVTGLCGADTSLPATLNVTPYPQVTILINAGQLQALPAGLAQYQWLYNNQPSGITGPVLTNPAPGIYSVIGINANGCADTSFSVAISSISEISGQDIQVYPNPVRDRLFVRSGNGASGVKVTRLLAGDGRVVYDARGPENSDLLEIDITRIPSGSYTLELISSAGVLFRKIMVAGD